MLIDIGGDNKLTVSVFALDPKVRCEGTLGGPGIIESCNNL